MPCYHKLKAFQYGAGEKISIISSKSLDHDKLIKRWYELKDSQFEFPRAIEVACQQCIGCRMTYARNWAIRCCLESLFFPKSSCWFVTLTYDDEHVPRSLVCNPDTGEVLYESMTLKFTDFQLFEKRFRENLRRNYGIDNVRFYYCGEYGSISMRPHYHFILFGLPYSKSIFSPYKYQNSGSLLYDIEPLMESWPYGLCPVGELTFDSAAYVAGYMLKKLKGKSAEYYKIHGLEPPFSGASNRPGIGRRYFDMYSDQIYEADSLKLRFGRMDFTPRPPRYFDELYKVNHAEEMYKIKAKRQLSAENQLRLLIERSGLTEEEYFYKEEERIKTSCIPRSKKI